LNWREEAVVFPCGEEELVGVFALPEQSGPRGVLIVVGGPQYRAGSHRQFTLLARYLAQRGIASLRFDYRGMGDSSGASRTFEGAEEDIRAAVDRLVERLPAPREVVIWGLCDAASAALIYAQADPRVSGLILVNPWVRTEVGSARAQLRHYYGARLLQASFWQKLAQGEFNPARAARSFSGSLMRSIRRSRNHARKPLPERMEAGLRGFRGRVLLILSGKDLTAQEFNSLVKSSPNWQGLLREPRVTRFEMPGANHTFSRRDWREQVLTWTSAWLIQERAS
jgi:exosortase A-associated hydrolase 1